jgi:hypothetical protein
MECVFSNLLPALSRKSGMRGNAKTSLPYPRIASAARLDYWQKLPLNVAFAEGLGKHLEFFLLDAIKCSAYADNPSSAKPRFYEIIPTNGFIGCTNSCNYLLCDITNYKGYNG